MFEPLKFYNNVVFPSTQKGPSLFSPPLNMKMIRVVFLVRTDCNDDAK